MNLQGIDHVEFHVDDAPALIGHFEHAYGFTRTATAEPDTGLGDRHSVLLTRGQARVVISTPLYAGGEVYHHIQTHGCGVHTVALRVADIAAAVEQAIDAGARLLPTPTPVAPRTNDPAVATLLGPEGIRHTLIEHSDNALLPGFRPVPASTTISSPGSPGGDLIRAIDHLAICLPLAALQTTATFYEQAFGLTRTYADQVDLGEQGMDSVVVQGGGLTITLVAPSGDDGQLVDFLTRHRGAGVQHVAFLTDDISAAVPQLRAGGVEFLAAPETYYEELSRRLGAAADIADGARRLGVLVDRDPWGWLYQVFTRSPFPRRTVFFEVIERRAARTFGAANVRALYEAAEAERLHRAGR